MMQLSHKQEAVIEAAKVYLREKHWFRGVCIEDMPSDEAIDENFKGCVDFVIFQTAMYDDPEFFK
jgi:hypothetical protein